MISTLFLRVLSISVSTSVVIAALLLLAPHLRKTYQAKWFRWVWLLVAVRLLLPVSFALPDAPITVQVDQTAVTAPIVPPSTDPVPVTPQTETPEAEPSSAPLTWLNLLALVWAIGGAGFLGYQTTGYLLYRKKLLRWSRPFNTPEAESVFRSAAARVGLSRPISLVVSGDAPSPMTLGFFRPVILLPSAEYAKKELTFILRHELTHCKRRDTWYKLLLLLANAVHWFNPLVYWMVRDANTSLELACDDQVTAGASPEERRAYVHTILTVMERQAAKAAALSTCFQGGNTAMKYRFSNILSARPKKNGAVLLLGTLLAVGLLGSLVSCSSQPQFDLPADGETNLELVSYEGKTAILTRDTELTNHFAISVNEKGEDVFLAAESFPLQKNDIVLILAEVEDSYLVSLPYGDVPRPQGLVKRSAVRQYPALFSQANWAILPEGTPAYTSPGGSPCDALPGIVRLEERQNGWSRISPAGGAAPVWVQEADLSYDFDDTIQSIPLP